jgi:hypothetical protein
MLNIINNIHHPLLSFVKDDPVRPEIPLNFRVSNGRFVGVLSEDKPHAIVCVSLHDFVPVSVQDLDNISDKFNIAVFYTIWSYMPGKARDLLLLVVSDIKKNYPSVSRFVTLSPKTELARKFHLRNGAILLQENEFTINYEYNNL